MHTFLFPIFHLRSPFAAMKNVKIEFRLDPKCSLEQEIPVYLVLVHEEIQGWTNREAWPDNKTQTVLRVVAETGVDAGVAMKVYKKEIRILGHLILHSRTQRKGKRVVPVNTCTWPALQESTRNRT